MIAQPLLKASLILDKELGSLPLGLALLIFLQVKHLLLKSRDVEAVVKNLDIKLDGFLVVADFFIQKSTGLRLFKLSANLQAILHGVKVFFNYLLDFRSDLQGL